METGVDRMSAARRNRKIMEKSGLLSKDEIEFLDKDDIPDNSPFMLEELRERILSDKRYNILWQRFIRGYSGAAKLRREIDYRLGHGQNNLFVEIYGPPGIGKSMVAITLHNEFCSVLRYRGILVYVEATLNYSQSTPAILKYPYSKKERVICIQDEDEELSGEDIIRDRKAFSNLIKQGRKLGFVLIKCNTDRDENFEGKVSFAIRVWGQIEGWLICMIESRTGYPLDFVRIKYPDKASRDWYENIKDASIVHLKESGGKFGADFSVDEENEKVEEVYKATLSKYPNQILTKDHFAQFAKSMSGKLGEDTWKRIKKLAWNKYTEGHPEAKKTSVIEYRSNVIKKPKPTPEPKPMKPKPASAPKPMEQLLKNAENQYVTKESIKKEIEFETLIVPKLGYTSYKGIQEGYGGRNRKGLPDGVAEKDGKLIVIGIEYNLGTEWNSNTIYKGRLESERKYARDNGAACQFFVWNEDKGQWYGPFIIDPNGTEDFTHSWDSPILFESSTQAQQQVADSPSHEH